LLGGGGVEDLLIGERGQLQTVVRWPLLLKKRGFMISYRAAARSSLWLYDKISPYTLPCSQSKPQ